MIFIEGKWYDGKSSAQKNAVLKAFDNGIIHVEEADTGDVLIQQEKLNARVSDRLADTPRFLTFSNGSILETEDNPAVDQLLKKLNVGGWMYWVHILESNKRYIFVASLLVLLFGAAMVKFGFPWAAKVIAARLPPSVFKTADRQTLDTLDLIIFKPTKLPSDTQQRVRKHFQRIIDTHKTYTITLAYRKGGKLGPNAFALPAGTIVFTDELIQLAKHDDELLSIMAHEIGHLVNQHAMRRIIQDSLLSFTILALTGDASGVSELFLGLPVLFTEMAYSRDFEREADHYALKYMQTHNIPLNRFSDILLRIEKTRKEKRKGKNSDEKWMDYLSTHPSTDERVKLFHKKESDGR